MASDRRSAPVESRKTTPEIESAIMPGYMSGFGNSFETEALPGALPIGRNSPQKVNYGLYAEQLADEQSFYDGDPVGRIGYLRWQLWRAARLVVDTGLHAQNWSRQRAIEYMIATTGDAPGVVITEVDRYIVWPGQACGYEIGRREIVRLREEARNELGPDFDLRGFHDAVLLSGDTPLSVLEQIVRDWIPEQRRLAERERRRR